MKILLPFITALAFSQCSLRGQGIINGGFEGYDPTSKFLVGWNLRFYDGTGNLGTVVDGVAGSIVPFNKRTPGPPYYATIYGKDSDAGGIPVDNYYLFSNGLGSLSVVAEQRVTIPIDVHTLQYRAFRGYSGGVSVQIDGVNLEPREKTVIIPGGTFGIVSDWWIDIGQYAGREVNVLFALGNGGTGLDDVRLSTEPIPEPSTISLFGIGCLGIGILYRKTQKI